MAYQGISSKNILAVEGKDEVNFFNALLKHQEIKNIQLIDIGGKDQFKFKFEALSILDNFQDIEKIGFVRDAEEKEAHHAFKSICKVLSDHSFPTPSEINSIADGFPKVGVFIMPNNKDAGMLENLCLESIRNTYQEKCIDLFFECVERYCLGEFSRLNLPKSKLLSYFSMKSPYVNSLGIAALKDHFDFDHECFNKIKGFLKILFT